MNAAPICAWRGALGGVLLAALLGAVAPAQAKNCTLVGGALVFGNYDPIGAPRQDSVGAVLIDCGGRFQGTLSVSVGNGGGASYADGRRMTRNEGPGTLKYNLYTDASRSQVLGDGTGGSATLFVEGGNTLLQPIWASILPGQSGVQAGRYNDVLIVTLSY